MAKIKLTETGYSLLQEGTTVLKITGVDYDEDFGSMAVKMQTKAGQTHTEFYNFIKANGEANDGAIKAFSYFAKTALNNFNLEEIEESDIIGCYIKAKVEHEEYESKKDKKMKTKAVLKDLSVAVGFDTTKPASADELDDFLDD